MPLMCELVALWGFLLGYHSQRRLEVPCQEGFQFLDDHYSIFESPVPSNLLQGHQGGETGESTFICKVTPRKYYRITINDLHLSTE